MWSGQLTLFLYLYQFMRKVQLSDVDFGTFASSTTSYSANVICSLSETTVTPSLSDSAASFVIKFDGVEDTDGVISLDTGSNVIAVVVAAEDG